MATEAQIEANQANAQKSTGPRTPEGKAIVAQNAVKHGLRAQEVVIKGEDPQEFELYRQGMLGELAPAGHTESALAERIVGLSWRLRRAERLQGAAVETLAVEKKKWVWSKEDNQYVILQATKPGAAVPGSEEEARAVDRRIVLDFGETRIFDRLLVYDQRIEYCLCRMMAELRRVQERRQAGAAVPGTGTRAAVRDTHPADLSRAGQDRPGRRSGPVRKVPPLDLALENLLADITALEGKRAAALMNRPAERSCQTKRAPSKAGAIQQVLNPARSKGAARPE